MAAPSPMSAPQDAGTDADLTAMIRAWRAGDLGARARLIEEAYERVRRIAAQAISARGGATLSPTELAHESLLRLLGAEAAWEDRRHFFHVVAQASRQVLVDHARRRQAAKRGAGIDAATLGEVDRNLSDPDERLVRISDALDALACADPRRAKVIDLTYFGGFTRDEVAGALGVSTRTVDSDLRFARAWLKEQIGA
jgi:RNA polymerase sigma factor (TIGR02999 family)